MLRLLFAVLVPAALAAKPSIHLVWANPSCGTKDEYSGWWGNIKRALQEKIDFASVWCPGNSAEQQQAAFDAIAAGSVGSERNVSVFVDFAPSLKNESYIAPLLRAGAAFFFLERVPDLEAMGIDRKSARAYAFYSDNAAGGRILGEIFCRTAEAPKNVVILRCCNETLVDDERMDGFLTAMQQHCGEVGHQVVEDTEAHWSPAIAEDTMKKLFIINPSINAVIAANDGMAIGAVEAARKVRSGGVKGLLVGGYDNDTKLAPYFADNSIFASIGQRMWHSTDGFIDTFAKILPIVQASPDEPSPGVPFLIHTPVIPVLPNMVAYTADLIMRDYDKTLKPLGQVDVSVGMEHMKFTNVDDIKGLVEIVATIVGEWRDERLVWDEKLNPESVQIPPAGDGDRVWTPLMYIQNEFESKVMQHIPVVITPGGIVRWQVNVKVIATCRFTVEMYPFDWTECDLMLTSPFPRSEVLLRPSLGFQIAELPKSFDLSMSAAASSFGKQSAAAFTLKMSRRPQSFYYRLVMPGVLLNVVGFSVYFIGSPTDSLAVAITMLLCSLAMRDSIELPDFSGLTWVELFMMFNIAFQGISFFMCSLEFLPSIKSAVDTAWERFQQFTWSRLSPLITRVTKSATKGSEEDACAKGPEEEDAEAANSSGVVSDQVDIELEVYDIDDYELRRRRSGKNDTEHHEQREDEQPKARELTSGSDMFGRTIVIPVYIILMFYIIYGHGILTQSLLLG